MKRLQLLSLLAFFAFFASAQNVGIGTPTPDASAILDVMHPNKGLLIPRVTLTGTNAATPITTPAVSLLVYNNAFAGAGATAVTPGYYYWSGTAWLRFTTGSGTETSWLLTGNAGTVDGTNFIGTTDNIPFNIRVSSQKSARIDHILGNAFWGYQAGNSNTSGFQNTAIGHQALSTNSTGGDNTATGYNALYINTGNSNTANGSKVLFSNTTGSDNTANGFRALYSNTTGYSNTANGSNALFSNTTGNSNTANGFRALFRNTTGNFNTATGDSALLKNTTGYQNTATGFRALYSNISGYSNTANGYQALYTNTGNWNTAIGFGGLYSNTSGNDNTALGWTALNSNTTGKENVAVGSGTSLGALGNNITGNYNSAVGFDALAKNTIGFCNTASGYKTLYSNTSGERNTAAGDSALYSNTSGYDNSAIGFEALFSNIDGSRNTAIGRGANYANKTGDFNTAIGAYALYENQFGVGNTAIGYGADVSDGTLTFINATAIGNGAKVNLSNKVRLGNNFVTVIEGQVAYSFPSDARFKYNIKNNVPGLDFITKLQPVTYYFDNNKLDEFTKTGMINNSIAKTASYTGEKQLHTGFLAQDVEKTVKELGYNFDGVHAPANDRDHYSLAYSQFIMPLVKSVQEQQLIIEEQNKKLNKQAEEIKKINEILNILMKRIKN